jgi:hypothetical protein
MTTIERFNNDHAISPAPGVIRDTLLAIAARLHREAVRLEGAEVDPEKSQDSIAEIARANIKKVLDAAQSNGRSSPH